MCELGVVEQVSDLCVIVSALGQFIFNYFNYNSHLKFAILLNLMFENIFLPTSKLKQKQKVVLHVSIVGFNLKPLNLLSINKRLRNH